MELKDYDTKHPMSATVVSSTRITPDDSDTVGRWYGETAARYSRQAVQRNDFTYRLASAERSFRRAEDGVGTFIQLYGACAQ